MRCRWAALALLAGLVATTGASPVTAHQPQPPWEASLSMEGEPRTGASTELAVELAANGDLEERTFELALPAHVGTDGDTRWQVDLEAGETRTRSWSLWTDEPGFWTARLADTNGTFEGPGCCLYVHSGPQAGLSGSQPEAAIPEPEATTATSFATEGAETVEVTYAVRREADWMRHGAF